MQDNLMVVLRTAYHKEATLTYVLYEVLVWDTTCQQRPTFHFNGTATSTVTAAHLSRYPKPLPSAQPSWLGFAREKWNEYFGESGISGYPSFSMAPSLNCWLHSSRARCAAVLSLPQFGSRALPARAHGPWQLLTGLVRVDTRMEGTMDMHIDHRQLWASRKKAEKELSPPLLSSDSVTRRRWESWH